jgi:hypothetical protein
MFWLFAIPAGLLTVAAAAAPRARVVTLQQGETYRFLFELTSAAPLTADNRAELLKGLDAMGAKDVLLLQGPPVLCMFTQKSSGSRTLQLGAIYAPFASLAGVPLVSLRLIQVEHLGAGGSFQAMGEN